MPPPDTFAHFLTSNRLSHRRRRPSPETARNRDASSILVTSARRCCGSIQIILFKLVKSDQIAGAQEQTVSIFEKPGRM